MKEKLYNDENPEYSRVISLLNDLPKINAPDNFEYNLMIKIQNGQFESSRKINRSTNRTWVFIPASAVILSSILLFLIFFDFNNKVEINEPAVDTKYISKIQNNTVNEAKAEMSVIKDKSLASTTSGLRMKKESRLVLHPNDVIETEALKYPFNESYSVDVDSYIDGNKKASSQSSNPAVLAASGGDARYPEFNGFYLRQNEQALINIYKARLDSIAKFLNRQSERK
jgi:hypothetical protein